MTPEEALMTILRLIDGSDEVEDEKVLQILLRSIKTLAEKGLGREPTPPLTERALQKAAEDLR